MTGEPPVNAVTPGHNRGTPGQRGHPRSLAGEPPVNAVTPGHWPGIEQKTTVNAVIPGRIPGHIPGPLSYTEGWKNELTNKLHVFFVIL